MIAGAVLGHLAHRAAVGAGASSSVGWHGDSYDSVLAECVSGPWRSLEQVDLATQNGSIGGTTNASTAPSEPPAGRILRLSTIENTRRTNPRDSKPLSLLEF